MTEAFANIVALHGTDRVIREITARFFPRLYDETTGILKDFIDRKGGKFTGKDIENATKLVQGMEVGRKNPT